MSIKNVVKVMNFHSLLRVDKSRNKAKKYTAVEKVLTDMIDNIVNNRNITLDFNTLKVKEESPVLSIYIGSDMGFCNNLNSLVNRVLGAEKNGEQIIVGRKIRPVRKETVIIQQTREEYDQDNTQVMDQLEAAIRGKKYSKIMLIYNHYYNSTQVQLEQKQVFPIEKREHEGKQYREDFTWEGDINKLLEDLVVLYIKYSMEIAAAASFAAENISRQNVTTESLHRIDDREAEAAMQKRKAEKDKQFAKVLDNFTKLRQY